MSNNGGVVVLYDENQLTNPNPNNPNPNSFTMKLNLTQRLRGGTIIEVSNPDQAKIAESAGACCVLIGGNTIEGSRMIDPIVIKEIKRCVSIPVIAKCRVGHFVEGQILESIGVDYVDENEMILVSDEENFINKHNFRTPFISGASNLGEALRRVREGAAMIRAQGEVNRVGNVSKTVKSVRSIMGSIRVLSNMDDDEVFRFAKEIGAPYDLVAQTKQMGRLPVVHFGSGGIVTPADAALMMQLGCDGVFVGVEVFDGSNSFKRVRAIVEAVRNYNDAGVLSKVCCGFDGDGDQRVVNV